MEDKILLGVDERQDLGQPHARRQHVIVFEPAWAGGVERAPHVRLPDHGCGANQRFSGWYYRPCATARTPPGIGARLAATRRRPPFVPAPSGRRSRTRGRSRTRRPRRGTADHGSSDAVAIHSTATLRLGASALRTVSY